MLNSFILGSVKNLEKEVSFYEKQVNLRSNEIHQLFQLVNLIMPSQQNNKITTQTIQ